MSDLHAPQLAEKEEDGPDAEPSAFQRLLAELENEHTRETSQLRDEVLRLSRTAPSGGEQCVRKRVTLSEEPQPFGHTKSINSVLNGPQMELPGVNADIRRPLRMPQAKKQAQLMASENFQLYKEWQEEIGTKKIRASGVKRSKSRVFYQDTDFGPEHVERRRSLRDVKCRCSLRRFPIHPSSSFKMFWELLGILILSVDVVYIPLQVFIEEPNAWTMLVDWTTLTYWTLDIFVSFLSGYFERDGQIVMDLSTIAKRYLKGWFELDMVIVTADMISGILELINADDMNGEGLGLARLGKFLRVARVIRTLRLLRLVKLRQLLYAIHERIKSESVSIIVGLAQNMLGLLIINHYVACCWFLIGKVTSPDSWILENHVQDMDPPEQYLVALHWSMTQFTPASMRVFPVNGHERLFTVAVLFVAIVVFSSFVSSITSAMTRLRGLTASVTSQKFLLRKYLKENRISKELSSRITRYIDLAVDVYQNRTTQEKVALLKLLSGPLTISLQREVHSPVLTVHPVFEHFAATSKSAISQICFTAVSRHFFSKGDMVFDAGVHAEFMYFLISGSLYYKRLKLPSRIRRTLPVMPGMWLSEPVLWMHWVHLGSSKATIESEIITIRSSTFRSVTMSYPVVAQYARTTAIEYGHWFESNVGRGLVWDLPVHWLEPDGTPRTPGASSSIQRHVTGLAEEEHWEVVADASDSDDETETVELPVNLRIRMTHSQEFASSAGDDDDNANGSINDVGSSASEGNEEKERGEQQKEAFM